MSTYGSLAPNAAPAKQDPSDSARYFSGDSGITLTKQIGAGHRASNPCALFHSTVQTAQLLHPPQALQSFGPGGGSRNADFAGMNSSVKSELDLGAGWQPVSVRPQPVYTSLCPGSSKDVGLGSRNDINMFRSRYRGVSYDKKKRKWRVQIKVASLGKSGVSVGYFDTEEAAARAYDRAAISLLGRHSCKNIVNFPLEDYSEEQIPELCGKNREEVKQSLKVERARVMLMYKQLCRRRLSHRRRTSKFLGVGSSNRKNQWQARILYHGRVTHLGYYSSEEEAARVYDRVSISLHGEQATTNFPIEDYSKDEELAGLSREDLQRALGVKPMDKSSQFRGVSKKKGKWEAKVMLNRKWAYRELFETEEEAARAYDSAVWRLKPREAKAYVNFKDSCPADVAEALARLDADENACLETTPQGLPVTAKPLLDAGLLYDEEAGGRVGGTSARSSTTGEGDSHSARTSTAGCNLEDGACSDGGAPIDPSTIKFQPLPSSAPHWTTSLNTFSPPGSHLPSPTERYPRRNCSSYPGHGSMESIDQPIPQRADTRPPSFLIDLGLNANYPGMCNPNSSVFLELPNKKQTEQGGAQASHQNFGNGNPPRRVSLPGTLALNHPMDGPMGWAPNVVARSLSSGSIINTLFPGNSPFASTGGNTSPRQLLVAVSDGPDKNGMSSLVSPNTQPFNMPTMADVMAQDVEREVSGLNQEDRHFTRRVSIAGPSMLPSIDEMSVSRAMHASGRYSVPGEGLAELVMGRRSSPPAETKSAPLPLLSNNNGSLPAPKPLAPLSLHGGQNKERPLIISPFAQSDGSLLLRALPSPSPSNIMASTAALNGKTGAGNQSQNHTTAPPHQHNSAPLPTIPHQDHYSHMFAQRAVPMIFNMNVNVNTNMKMDQGTQAKDQGAAARFSSNFNTLSAQQASAQHLRAAAAAASTANNGPANTHNGTAVANNATANVNNGTANAYHGWGVHEGGLYMSHSMDSVTRVPAIMGLPPGTGLYRLQGNPNALYGDDLDLQAVLLELDDSCAMPIHGMDNGCAMDWSR